MNYRKAFYAFVQRRFYEVAATGFEFDGGSIGAVTVTDRPEDEWNDWRIASGFEGSGFATLAARIPYIPMQRVTVEDGGRERLGAVVMFGLDVLFGDRGQSEREERYAQYLRLKAEFEPSAD